MIVIDFVVKSLLLFVPSARLVAVDLRSFAPTTVSDGDVYGVLSVMICCCVLRDCRVMLSKHVLRTDSRNSTGNSSSEAYQSRIHVTLCNRNYRARLHRVSVGDIAN